MNENPQAKPICNSQGAGRDGDLHCNLQFWSFPRTLHQRTKFTLVQRTSPKFTLVICTSQDNGIVVHLALTNRNNDLNCNLQFWSLAPKSIISFAKPTPATRLRRSEAIYGTFLPPWLGSEILMLSTSVCSTSYGTPHDGPKVVDF